MTLLLSLRVLHGPGWPGGLSRQALLGWARVAPATNLSTSPALPASGESERYLQRSRVPTLHFQPSLPRLPVPRLSDTCQRYLAALRPVVSDQQFLHTQNIVKEFEKEGGEGHELDKRLRQLDAENKHTSYISGPWYNMYLSSRDPLVLNYNPFMAWKEDPHTTNQAVRASKLIRAAVLFRNSLEAGLLEPDVFHLNPANSDTELFRNMARLVPSALSWYVAYLWKAFPLDMSQYPHLLCSTRLPQQGCDQLAAFPGHSHVVVLRNGHFFSLPAADPDGLPVCGVQLQAQLQWVLEQPLPPPTHPLSFLTTLDRDYWASLRKELVGVSETNLRALEVVDSALLVVCLDDAEPQNEVDVTHRMLHNYGANRWFDKSVSMILDKGVSALNFEHAWGDGVAVLRFFTELHKHSIAQPYTAEAGQVQASGEGVQQLEFQLTDRIKLGIERGREEVEERCNSLSVSTLLHEQFGSAFIKSKDLRSDAFIQLAIQVAYYRQYKELVPTYESCSTAAFRHGRTETIRPASSLANECAELMERTHPASVEEMMEVIKKATAYHFNLTRQAAMGQGFDRHMFALRTLAEEAGLRPGVFEDPSHHHMAHIILSTSTLSTDSVLIGGFAPVTSDGYGIGYNVAENAIGCNTTTYPSRDGSEFISHLRQVLEDLHCLLSGNNFK